MMWTLQIQPGGGGRDRGVLLEQGAAPGGARAFSRLVAIYYSLGTNFLLKRWHFRGLGRAL